MTPERVGGAPEAEELREAARDGDAARVAAALAAGAYVEWRDAHGDTALFEACNALGAEAAGRVEAVRVLLAAGARTDAASSLWGGRTPLHAAVWRDQRRIVELLVAAGADLRARDASGSTPLHLAEQYKRSELEAILRPLWEPREESPAPLVGPPVAHKLVVHPARPEGVTTLRHGALARWALEDPPRLLASRQTVYPAVFGLAAEPRAGGVALGLPAERVEFRRWDDLSLSGAVAFPDSRQVPTIALSPDGRWLAGDAMGEVRLIERATGRVTARVESGERNDAMTFDPTSRLLATACSFQGGGHVRVDRVGDDGRLTPAHVLWRSEHGTPESEFVDTLADVAFSPDGRRLAVFQTSAIYHDAKPPGWRGDLVLYELERGSVVWQRSVDASVTGDRATLKEAGHGMGFWTELAWTGRGEIACGATGGLALVFSAESGEVRRRIDLGRAGAVTSLAFHAPTECLWGVVGGEVVRVPLTDGA